MPVPIVPILYGLGAAFSAYSSNKAGQDAKEVGQLNARLIRETAEANTALGLEAAAWNAGSVLRVGNANARAIEDVYNQNAVLMGIEGAEAIRRHFREEQQMLGTIRAMQGGSGADVNHGTNLHYFLDQAYEAEWSREYQVNRTKLSILNYMDEQQTRADLTRLDASERATAIQYNALIESNVAMNEANMQALSAEAGGNLQASVGRMNAYSSLIGGATKAYGAWAT